MKSACQRFEAACQSLPLVAILRGLTPSEARGAGEVLYHEGFRLVEVPLNSPDPFTTIKSIRAALPNDCLVGAGTVLHAEDANKLADLGADLVIMPHFDEAVVRRAKELGLVCMPGVATPSEAFAAIRAGADALKLFPGELITPQVVKSMRVVLPKNLGLFPVGGVTPQTMGAYLDAGAAGVGLGSALYKAGMPVEELRKNAAAFVQSWQKVRF